MVIYDVMFFGWEKKILILLKDFAEAVENAAFVSITTL